MNGKISNIAARILIRAWYKDVSDLTDSAGDAEMVESHLSAPKEGDWFDLSMGGASMVYREDGWYIQEGEEEDRCLDSLARRCCGL